MGRLIVIEGLDGSGKATQARLLARSLREAGNEVHEISFPCYDDESSLFVRQYLRGDYGSRPGDVGSYAASMFYAADRYISYKKRWGALYERGGLFVADRYTTSNAVYQASKLSGDEWDAFFQWIEDFEYVRLGLPRPCLVLYLDVEIFLSEKLLLERYAKDTEKMDIHESAPQFQQESRKAALYYAKTRAWQVISCCERGVMRKKEDIAAEIYALVSERLPL